MSGVTPDSTTAALAGNIPKESVKTAEETPGVAAISSAAPESSTAELAKDVPLENNAISPPGGFPETPTPAKEAEQFSVNPIPATSGVGNPIHLEPGEKVPDPSTLTDNTINSTVTTSPEGYAKDASSEAFKNASNNNDAVSALPVETNSINGPADPHIQSAAPMATTAALAGAVPLESSKAAEPNAPAKAVPDIVKESLTEANKGPEAAGSAEAVEEKNETEQELLHRKALEDAPAHDVPGVVRKSLSKADKDPEAAANAQAVEDKKGVENELLHKETGSSSVAAADVPTVVKDSLTEAHKDPEAAGRTEAVEEKKEFEQELLKTTKPEESAGEPAPTTTAATAATAPGHSESIEKKNQIREISPKSREPAVPPAEPIPDEPTVTTGPVTTAVPQTTYPKESGTTANGPTSSASAAQQPGSATGKEPNTVLGTPVPSKEVRPPAETAGPTTTQTTTEPIPKVTTTAASSDASVGAKAAEPKKTTLPTTDSTKPAPAPAPAAAAAAPASAPVVQTAAKKEPPAPAAQTENATKQKKKSRASGFFSKLKEKFKDF